MTDFRALCAELVQAIESQSKAGFINHDLMSAYIKATHALTQPEPMGPTDEGQRLTETLIPTDEQLVEFFNENDWNYISPETFIDIARSVLECYGHPTPQPIPVSERLPGAGDLDHEGTCWMWNPLYLYYCLCRPDPSVHTHWLPHHALPLPPSQ